MQSTVIAAYEYNALSETLTIRCHSGKVYNYLHVPEKVSRQCASRWLKASGSTGISKANIHLRK
jgi:hypothetical protein